MDVMDKEGEYCLIHFYKRISSKKKMAQLSTEDWEEKIRNPDPRVKWAMDVMDKEGNDFEGFIGRIWAPMSSAIFPVCASTAYNVQARVPLRTNLIPALIATPFFGLIGYGIRRFFDNRRAEEEAIMRHYILTHPEQFPEPKRTKYIDMIQPWKPWRW